MKDVRKKLEKKIQLTGLAICTLKPIDTVTGVAIDCIDTKSPIQAGVAGAFINI